MLSYVTVKKCVDIVVNISVFCLLNKTLCSVHRSAFVAVLADPFSQFNTYICCWH